MKSVFIVQHLHVLSGAREDVKLIGVYRSAAAARSAVDRLREQPGFRDLPRLIDPLREDDKAGFSIDEFELDQDHWIEGYATV